jgi:ribosomal protein L9
MRGFSRNLPLFSGKSGDCSKTRVAVPRGYSSKWLFPQEKATSHTFREGTFTLVLL